MKKTNVFLVGWLLILSSMGSAAGEMSFGRMQQRFKHVASESVQGARQGVVRCLQYSLGGLSLVGAAMGVASNGEINKWRMEGPVLIMPSHEHGPVLNAVVGVVGTLGLLSIVASGWNALDGLRGAFGGAIKGLCDDISGPKKPKLDALPVAACDPLGAESVVVPSPVVLFPLVPSEGSLGAGIAGLAVSEGSSEWKKPVTVVTAIGLSVLLGYMLQVGVDAYKKAGVLSVIDCKSNINVTKKNQLKAALQAVTTGKNYSEKLDEIKNVFSLQFRKGDNSRNRFFEVQKFLFSNKAFFMVQALAWGVVLGLLNKDVFKAKGSRLVSLSLNTPTANLGSL